jgi:acetyltransferase-like isoleucine patch superfamily enzyme
VIHPTAEIEEGARVGANTRIWHYCHIRAGAIVGNDCNFGHSVYIDHGAIVGNNVKLQNRVSVYRGVTLEDGVFVGPHTTFTNDKHPRAIDPEGHPLSDEDWMPVQTLVKYGASIGAGCVVLPGVTIGSWAMVGAGALVLRDVPDHALAVGTPATVIGYVCKRAHRMVRGDRAHQWTCKVCHEDFLDSSAS